MHLCSTPCTRSSSQILSFSSFLYAPLSSLLSGVGATIPDFRRFLAERLDLSVDILGLPKWLHLSREVAPKIAPPAPGFAGCVGLALRGLEE